MPERDDEPTGVRLGGMYCSRYPQVIFEEEDHEIVVVNLLEGTYYYLTGTAAYVWLALHSGLTPAQIVQGIESHVSASVNIASEVEAFLQHLLNLGLVSSVAEVPAETLPEPAVGDFLGRTYQSPVIETYSDLQDILLLDPVHDVDESGWPTPRKA